MRYVNLALDLKSEYTDTLYTYSASDDVEIGDRVSVNFARLKKAVEGYVVQTDVTPTLEASKIKAIIEIDKRRSLNEEMVDTAMKLVRRNGFKYIDAIKLFTVGGKRENADKSFKIKTGTYPEYDLTPEQIDACEKILPHIESRESKAFLIKGVTNSGKTEVYMQAVQKALEAGRTAIVLVPEIALSAQTEKRFKDRFGDEMVATLHSKLSTSKRLEEWLKLKEGRAKIAIGARTAVFSPLDDIGVIIIDEEHESTYKSDHNPKYETIDVAFIRAQFHHSVLILGSATPSVVSYDRAKNGIYELIEMKSRIGESRMPAVEIIDMREEMREGNLSPISVRLKDEISETLKRGEQVILFLNRRGFSTNAVCGACGYRMDCPDCGISMTYHKSDNAMVCHYCGKKQPVPKKCPECGSDHMRFIGTGTEKIEENISKLFPGHSVGRFDLDTAKSQKEIDDTIKDFTSKKTEILVGTQILAKGLDFQNVGLVGIVMADLSLNIPDYRSAERTYQLITQVSGRAGRDREASKVLIQTFVPEDEVIVDASKGNYEEFYKSELLHRQIMSYPPFADIIKVSFVDRKGKKNDPSIVLSYAKDFKERLEKLKDAPKDATIFDPREESIKLGRDRNRASFLIKAPKGSRAGYVKAYQDYRDMMLASNAPCHIEMDVNPY